MPEMRRFTLHTAAVVIQRDRRRLMHGENRCGAPSYPGCTTAVDAGVTCPKCVEILKQEAK